MTDARPAPPPRWRRALWTLFKIVLTVGGFWLLLTHEVDTPAGPLPVATAVADHLATVDASTFALWAGVAMAVKFVGVLASALGWWWLQRGQGVHLPFWQQTVTAFLIGRFIGTFLPSTVGLDGYTLYEAGRYTHAWPRVTTAKVLEKFVGLAGLMGGVMLTLPAGYLVLRGVAGEQAGWITAVIGLVSAGFSLGTLVAVVLAPVVRRGIGPMVGRLPGPVGRLGTSFLDAAAAYAGPNLRYVLGAFGAKFVTHATTAVVYWFTALAIGVVDPPFLEIVFGSLLQIFGTLLSPTVAGEGAREALQALLLSSHYGGAAQAVLAAALGFVAAEAATLWGGAFWWTRTPTWRPRFALVDGEQVDYAWLADDPAG